MNSSKETQLWLDLVDYYLLNKRKIDSILLTKNEKCLFNFCFGINSNELEYKYLCKLVLIFANVLKRKMPEPIHNRMILDTQNEFTKKYVEYVKNLKKNKFLIFNQNKNNYSMNKLGKSGDLHKLMYK